MIEAKSFPLSEALVAGAKLLGVDPLKAALTGGEDYELIFTAPESPEAAALGTKIGVVTEGSVVRVVDQAGEAIALDQTGFRHFS